MDRSEILEMVLDHYHNPHNRGELTDANAIWNGGLPGCSDIVTTYLKIENGRIIGAAFTGEGCTISQAATSMLTEELVGQDVEAVAGLDQSTVVNLLGKELVQTRPRCATLGLDTFRAAAQEYMRLHPTKP
ncbi:nifU homolog [Longilinea arvoryzae]|uniref:NifU homolog n=1 Tax=Longilinea arvoryzae TaxID=360412 RepID=A0A0S7BC25_9CHLR|nr:iron-sulfur cluster assembly scaffold protein [Longilinea arvoryzae]GAP15423.1 nifU homolog [Longilinea arvoryzae]